MDAVNNGKSGLPKLALKSMVLGFGLAAFFLSLELDGRNPIWNAPGRLFIAGIFLSVLAMPVLFLYSALQGRGPFRNWPKWKVFENGTDGRGLPVVSWREGNYFVPPRRLWVQQSPGGEWQVVFSRPRIVDPSSGSRGSLAFGMLGPFIHGLTRMTRDGGSVETHPWNDLVTIEVVPWTQRHGGVGLFTHVKREHSDLLVAHFADGRTMELSDWWWSKAALGHLSSMISKEFIDRRGEHVKRMASAARAAQNAEIGERKKAV